MSSKVEFKSKVKMGTYELRDISEDDFAVSPEVFKNESDDNAHAVLVDQYGMLFVDGDTSSKPLYYMRHALIDESRFGGIIELGDSIYSTQVFGDCDDLMQRGPIHNQYCKLSNQPMTYGYGTDEPFSEYRFYEDYSTWKEADVLDIKATYAGQAMVDHQASFKNLPQIIIPCRLEGTYRGKKVSGLGEWAKNYQLSHKPENILTNLGYICLDMLGIRCDGRLERAFVAIDQSGSVGALYHLEGKEPIISDTLSFEADWHPLPYVNDGTCVYDKAVIRFGGKEIHVNGKWGSKGVTKNPRIDKHGQSHVFGSWYEGSVPYQHEVCFCFGENMEAFDTKLAAMGFNVIDKEEKADD